MISVAPAATRPNLPPNVLVKVVRHILTLALQLDQCRASHLAHEDSRDQLRRELLDCERRLNQCQDAAENSRREGTELRRNLADVSKERDTLGQSNTQLRVTLRSAETERIR